MSNKYSDARYPEKINDLIDNEGQISEAGQAAVAESVNKAMEEGDIPTAPKLYRHRMIFYFEKGNYQNFNIMAEYISTKSTQLTLDDFTNNEIAALCVGKVGLKRFGTYPNLTTKYGGVDMINDAYVSVLDFSGTNIVQTSRSNGNCYDNGIEEIK